MSHRNLEDQDHNEIGAVSPSRSTPSLTLRSCAPTSPKGITSLNLPIFHNQQLPVRFFASKSAVESPSPPQTSLFSTPPPSPKSTLATASNSSNTGRNFVALSVAEERDEKLRVSTLSAFQKDAELRAFNREIAKLETLRAINTGERYTWTGRYKALARDYGFPLVAWYWVVWISMAASCYAALTVGQVDAIELLQYVEKTYTSGQYDLVNRIDPELGQLGLAVVLNEFLEPLRLPLVIVTVKPVMDHFFPPKY
jgi:Protein of unknown function (DUF1279)